MSVQDEALGPEGAAAEKVIFDRLNEQSEAAAVAFHADLGPEGFAMAVGIDPEGRATMCWRLPLGCRTEFYGGLIHAFQAALEQLMPPPVAQQADLAERRVQQPAKSRLILPGGNGRA